jgi:hypothetical protein
MYEVRYENARGTHTTIFPGTLPGGIGTSHCAMKVAKASQGQSLRLSG